MISRGRLARGGAILAAVVIVVAAVYFWPPQKKQNTLFPNVNQVTDVTRQTYSDLYQASWRVDQVDSNVLVTATLFFPKLISTLGDDTGRSEPENQLYSAVKDTASDQLAFFLTIDSVGAPQTDEDIKNSLKLTVDQDEYTLQSWDPLILPSRSSSESVQTYAQSGVVIFSNSAGQPINWGTIKSIELTSQNLGGTAVRKFTWADPSILQSEN